MATPTRATSEQDLDEFNKQLRSSPLYQQFMQSRGLKTDGHVKLSRKQQSDLEDAMSRSGFPVPKGMHIDQGGNMNQKNRTGRNIAIATAIGVGTIATLGAAGVIGGGVLGTGIGGGGAAATAAGAGAGAGASGAAAGGAAAGGGLLASSAAPIAYTGLAPTAAMVGTGATTAGVGAASAASAANMAFGGTGVLGAGGGGGGSLAALASTPTAAGIAPYSSVATGGGGGGSALTSAVTKGGGMGADTWIDVGSKGADFLGNYIGGKTASASNDKAADLQRQTAKELLEFERQKQKDTLAQQQRKEAAEERNFKVEQEEKLENLRRLDEKESQGEPARLAREATYRAYMKKYWDIDVAPSVARTARNIQSAPVEGRPPAGGPPVADAPPTSHTMSGGAGTLADLGSGYVEPSGILRPTSNTYTSTASGPSAQYAAMDRNQPAQSIAAAIDPVEEERQRRLGRQRFSD